MERDASKRFSAAEEFLEKANIRTLIEWLTAEILLKRPKNTMRFAMELFEQKLKEHQRDDSSETELFERYLSEVYEKANDYVEGEDETEQQESAGSGNEDGEGRKESRDADEIHLTGSQDSKDQASKIINIEKEEERNDTHEIQKGAHKEADSDESVRERFHESTDELLRAVLELLTKPLMKPDSDDTIQLCTRLMKKILGRRGDVSADSPEVTFYKVLMEDKQLINASDLADVIPFEDKSAVAVRSYEALKPIFEPSETGIPILDSKNTILGVFVLKHGSEGQDSLSLCTLSAKLTGLLLGNADMLSSLRRGEERFEAMLDIIKSLHSDLGVNSILFTLSNRAHTLVDADRCSVFLYDEKKNELSSLQGELDERFLADKGIIDPRFNKDVDKKTRYTTKTILSLPIRDADNKVIGAVQVINKKGERGFCHKDINIMQYFLKITGPLLSNSQLYLHQTRRRLNQPETIDNEYEGPRELLKTRKSSREVIVVPPVVREAPEEDS